jgi:hypothetical protein
MPGTKAPHADAGPFFVPRTVRRRRFRLRDAGNLHAGIANHSH